MNPTGTTTATSGVMRGGDEGFYRSCPLRKGHPFKLRHDSVKFPRTGHPRLIVPGATSSIHRSPTGYRANPRRHSADYAEYRFSSPARSETSSADGRCVNIDFLLRPICAIRRSCEGRGSQLLNNSVLNNACPTTVRKARWRHAIVFETGSRRTPSQQLAFSHDFRCEEGYIVRNSRVVMVER